MVICSRETVMVVLVVEDEGTEFQCSLFTNSGYNKMQELMKI